MNITLIGMSGVGKSTVGKVIAEKLQYACIDTDRLIEERMGMALQEVLDSKGEKEFLALEAEVIESLGALHDTVLAPGGSIVYLPQTMEHLKKISKIVHLSGSLPVLRERNTIRSRGIVGLGEKTYEELYRERMELYNRYADFIIDMGRDTPEQIAERIVEIVNT